jgi:glucose-6-phosphate 1-dehydrogenase
MADTPQLEPSIIVIFGVTGDLSKRYLLPALYHLFKDNLLHEHTVVLGLTRQSLDAKTLFEQVELCINEVDNVCDPVALAKMQAKTELYQFDPAKSEDYPTLLDYLNGLEETHGMCMNRLYYLSIPPSLFTNVVHNIGEAGLNTSCQHGNAKTRLLVEKPFGNDLASAQDLITKTNEVFQEEQVFRIDHYLAKETVQNILSFRLHNPVFASIWDAEHITSVDITASEKISIEGRVSFYEGLGALRDLIQSHLLQLLALTLMDLPNELNDEQTHHARQALLEAVQPADPAQAVRGQYEGYRQEVGNTGSTTETYARLKLQVNSERWEAMPIVITTGKSLDEKRTEIIVTFKNPHDEAGATNTLTFRLQPNEGIHLQLRVKQPGFETKLQEAVMDFSYAQAFGLDSGHPSAYERVLVDAVKGDRTLFATGGEVLASWRIIEPVIAAWQGNADGLQTYTQGSSGPGLVQ